MNAGFWFDQLFHLACHVFMVATFYWAVFHFPARLKRPLGTKPMRVDGESVRLWRGVKDGRTNELQIEFEVPPFVRFSLRQETLFDRIAKAAGIVREASLSSQSLDRAVFLDVPGSLQRLSEIEPQTMPWIAALLKRLGASGGRLVGLWADGGRMKLHLLVFPPRTDPDPLVISAVQWLQAPLAALRRLPGDSHPDSPWPTLNRQLKWLFLLAATSGLLWLHFANEHIESYTALALVSSGLALLLTIVWLIWLMRRFDLGSTRHRVVWRLLAYGWPLLWMQSALLLRQANVSLDIHPAIEAQTLATAQLARVPRRKVHDALEIGYQLPDGQSGSLQVGLLRYVVLNVRWTNGELRHARLLFREGALGFRWWEIVDEARDDLRAIESRLDSGHPLDSGHRTPTGFGTPRKSMPVTAAVRGCVGAQNSRLCRA